MHNDLTCNDLIKSNDMLDMVTYICVHMPRDQIYSGLKIADRPPRRDADIDTKYTHCLLNKTLDPALPLSDSLITWCVLCF